MLDSHRQKGTVDLLPQKQCDNALQFGTGLCILRNRELEFERHNNTLPTNTTTQFRPGTTLTALSLAQQKTPECVRELHLQPKVQNTTPYHESF
jgi:hypothetical protein